jgi:hypothetical protein
MTTVLSKGMLHATVTFIANLNEMSSVFRNSIFIGFKHRTHWFLRASPNTRKDPNKQNRQRNAITTLGVTAIGAHRELIFNVIWALQQPFRSVCCINNGSQSSNNATLRQHLLPTASVHTLNPSMVLATNEEEIFHLLMKRNIFK